MKRFIVVAVAVLGLVACGEDEPPTFEELMDGWRLNYGSSNFGLDGARYGRQYSPRDFTPLACALMGQDVTCYSLDNGCGAGQLPSICFNDKAELVGCIRGEDQLNDEDLGVTYDTFPDQLPMAVIAGDGANPVYICEDQSLPQS